MSDRAAEHVLNVHQRVEVEAMRTGLLGLTRFMTRREHESVLRSMELPTSRPWPVPIVLDVPESVAREAESRRALNLRDREGVIVGVIRNVLDVWRPDKKAEAIALFGDRFGSIPSSRHPGLDFLFARNDWVVGGEIEFASPHPLPRIPRDDFGSPCLAFQTRRPMLTNIAKLVSEAAERFTEGSCVVQVPNGPSVCEGEIDPLAVSKTWGMAHSEPALSGCRMRVSSIQIGKLCRGPREALIGCIVAKNSGCTHLLITPEAEHVGTNPAVDFQEAKRLVKERSRQFGIEPLFFDQFVRGSSTSKLISAFDATTFDKLRAGVFDGVECSSAVEKVLRDRFPPRNKQGFCVLFTGLSGSGKSSLARALSERIEAEDAASRKVTILDGDLVRHNLSKGLGFSREDREANVLRIGFVASLVASSGGIALCAPIAPYSEVRARVRKMCSDAGAGFIEVHVATPLEECERRDSKGLYAKARRGEVKNFTGINDPYEEPKSPEVRVDTTSKTVNESVSDVWNYLIKSGFIKTSHH